MIDDVKRKVFKELVSFSEGHLSHRDHFICVYGSFASIHNNAASDIDMFIAVENYEDNDFYKILDFMIDLHNRNKLRLDDEVPYENKLVVSYNDIYNALALKPFIKKGKKYHVPSVDKNKEFLGSPEIRWRLILNALTSPHEYICGSKDKYMIFRNNAEKSIVQLACGLAGVDRPSIDEAFKHLITGSRGEEGEMYLGYKRERDDVMKYLKEVIERNYTSDI